MQAPRRRETGRQPAAQFAPRPASIQDGSAARCGKKGDATVVTADLICRARAGDGQAFRELTEPHLRELQVRCYWMLGSFADAEDVLQDTLLAAWQGLAGFEGRLAGPGSARGRPGGRTVPGRVSGHRRDRSPGRDALLRRWDDARRRAWNGSWNGAPDNPGTAGAMSAITHAISAARAHSARRRTYGKEKVYGSIP